MIARMIKFGMMCPEFQGTETIDILECIKASARGAKETAFLTPGSPKEGKRLFARKGCIRCHAIRGEGGKRGEDKVPK